MTIEMIVNGQTVHWRIEPHEFLTEVLRKNGLKGVKRGCESGDCGVCAVLMDGREIPSCIVLAAQADGHEIVTIEGLGSREQPHAIQRAFVDNTAVQCGFCTPGMVIATKDLLDRHASPSEAEARAQLAGHYCRCTGHVKPIRAVLAAAQKEEAGHE